ncbi:hypothetical protein MKUB_54050 [Mycobacterium kubicae]|uniref:LemA family protein n=1 Tax=Mycobacterium kubicae TaxID=120959 RepID=A0AAX1J417_9MYCO|nr:hypothetical protein [Mycobacterium kubicae]MCV7097499.1 hypothetical protein [Mycobacterium kubicae]QNI12678.1 hypothetical protein GAN18_17015 [Mycobacterium kubicae]QPI36199.1 hypothetical protein I2456_16795 [Mycobacterium kubicae]GFG67915.1 hypothetical protein MKUB_54050 [Mycobacterium kubicae]
MLLVPLAPLPVEITNHTEWWQPWLPVGTGLVVAMVAFAGVLLSNRTNRRAIAAADGREVDKWRRDTLLRLCSDAVTASLDVETLYEKGVEERQNLDGDAIAAAIHKIGPVAETINLIGITALVELARRLEEACNGIQTYAEEFVVARITYENLLDDFKNASPEATPLEVAAASNEARQVGLTNAESEFAASIARMATVRGFFIQKAGEVLNEKTSKGKKRRWYFLHLR